MSAVRPGHVCCIISVEQPEVRQLPAAQCRMHSELPGQGREPVLDWPLWIAENGCVAPPWEGQPPDQMPSNMTANDIPVCCLTQRRHRYQYEVLAAVQETNFASCVSSANPLDTNWPVPWTRAPSCISGNPMDNYKDCFPLDGSCIDTNNAGVY